jgi:HEAT repeat protein
VQSRLDLLKNNCQLMNIFFGGRYRNLIFAFLALMVPGCADLPAWVPFQGPRSDTVPGVVTPAEKIANLKKLASSAATSDQKSKHQVVEQLVTSIRSESDPLIRVEIIHTLGDYPDPAADSVLKAALNDPDLDVRVAACEAWGKRGDAQAAGLLVPLLSGDVSRDVRLAAARALGKIKDPQAVTALGDMLVDSDPALQYRAVMSLKEITGKDLGNNVDRWREYVKQEHPQPDKPQSLADKAKKLF